MPNKAKQTFTPVGVVGFDAKVLPELLQRYAAQRFQGALLLQLSRN
jgi:hypothetical protein